MDGAAPQVLPYFPPPVILEAVAATFGIGVDRLRADTTARKGERLGNYARAAAALLLRDHSPISNLELARALGRKDSCTGGQLLKAAALLLEKDPRFGQTLELARRRLVEGFHG